MLLSSSPITHPPVHEHKLLTLAAVLSALLLALFSGSLPAQAQDRPAPGAPAAITTAPPTYLVQFQPGYAESERSAWLARQGIELVAWLPQINVAEVRPLAGPGAGDAAGFAALLAAGADPAPILYIEADAAVTGDLVITDPAFGNLNQSYAQQLLHMPTAFDVTEGDGNIVIAIVDSGINARHPEFKDRILPGYDFVNSDADAADDHGHGTHIAGIAAAGLNGVGTVGVCPQCKLMPVKVLNARNGGTWSLVAKGILYAVDHGARVINLSLGATLTSATLEAAVKYAQEHDVVIVAAAGNTGSATTFYPAAIPYVIAVSGTDRTDVRWPQSSYGDYVDVAAPAVAIYSTYHDLYKSSGYAYMSGTSMASPFVAGLAGLAFSRQPSLSAREVTDLITSNTVDLGAAGKDAEYGYGRIDAYATLLAANEGVVPTPQIPPDDGGEGKGGDPGKEIVRNLYLPALSSY